MSVQTTIFIIIFAVMFLAAWYWAFSIAFKYWKLAHLAQPDEIKTPMGERVKNVFIYVLLQKKLMKRPARGIFHIFVIGGFGIYSLHTLSQFIGGFMGDYHFYLPAFLGTGFEHFYDSLLDLFSVLVLAGLGFFAFRRWGLKAPELDRPSNQSIIVIGMISALMLFTLFGEPAKMIMGNFEAASPIRIILAKMYQDFGVDPSSAVIIYKIGWWGHVITVFAFMVFVPGSKHAHLIWAPFNFWFKKDNPNGEIPFLDTENATVWGATNIQDFTWKNLLDSLSCIECGRCTLVCPANRTGKVLDPKKIMNEMKHSLMEQMPKVKEAKESGKSDEEIMGIDGVRVIDNYISQEALWGCTTCFACAEACPVGNNQPESILQMRRALVLNEGSLPTELQGALTNIENQSNPWGVGSHKREEWAEGLNVKTMANWKESGEEPEVLYWVGCAGAFDDRSIKIAKSFTNVMQKAGVQFGILGTEENCTGDSARRAGNEYLYQMLAQTNIDTMNGYNVKKIVATCPHCFNTLQNEYPQLGGNYEVIHHGDYMQQLIAEGRLKLDSEKAKDLGMMTYHDSCYLGRYNDIYSAPRDLISQATGNEVVEACDHHDNGLCCGAGGAQMWMEEQEGSDKRVFEMRTDQLVETNANTIATACPFCMTMVSDGVKGLEKEESVKTLDIAEIIEKAMV